MASYKLIFKKADGNTKTFTESHPKLDATENEKGQAMLAIGGNYNMTPLRIDVNSDTTVWTAA